MVDLKKCNPKKSENKKQLESRKCEGESGK